VETGKKTYTKTQKKKRRRFFLLQKRYWAIIIPLVLCAGLFYYYILKDLPSPTKLSSDQIPQSSQIFDRHGTLLYTIYGKHNQTFTPLNKIPKTVQQATIAIEDKDFYNHGPLDFRGIARAFYETVFHKQTQGGSTLTQQLIKNTLLSDERTLLRKARETVLAVATEIIYPKSKILEMYLNQIPYGGTAYGIEAASLNYFGIHANKLDLAQSALLAGLPQSPTSYSPFGAHPELAKYRQMQVLNAMKQQKYITQAQEDQAAKEELHYQNFGSQIKAPHFVLWVKQLLEEQYGEKLVEQGGLQVTTSLDLPLQEYAQATVAAEVAKVKEDHVSNGAALITNPGTGEILAMVGSKDYFDTNGGNVNIVIAKTRQPGSSIKPINYAVGLIKGYTAATQFVDEPICFPSPDGKPYCPRNYDGGFHGIQTMRNALGNSFNIPAVKMLKANGIDAMIATASAMGITSLNDPRGYGLSLTLGGAEISMLDMVTAYGVFANGGYRIDLHPILKVTNSNGKIIDQYHPPTSPIFGKQVIPPGVAFIISDILADNNARLIDFGFDNELKIGKKYVSAKTGTTNDFRDNWTFGYTPNYVVGVWVGNNDNSPMNGLASGITGAAPIWHDLMAHMIDKQNPVRPQPPSDVFQHFSCYGTAPTPPPGGSPNPTAPASCSGYNEYFIKGTEKNNKTTYSTEKVWIDKTSGAQGAPGQTDNIELRDETFVTDPSGDKYCLSCAHPTPVPTGTPGH
jgi:penicillin-binding protein 1C